MHVSNTLLVLGRACAVSGGARGGLVVPEPVPPTTTDRPPPPPPVPVPVPVPGPVPVPVPPVTGTGPPVTGTNSPRYRSRDHGPGKIICGGRKGRDDFSATDGKARVCVRAAPSRPPFPLILKFSSPHNRPMAMLRERVRANDPRHESSLPSSSPASDAKESREVTRGTKDDKKAIMLMFLVLFLCCGSTLWPVLNRYNR